MSDRLYPLEFVGLAALAPILIFVSVPIGCNLLLSFSLPLFPELVAGFGTGNQSFLTTFIALNGLASLGVWGAWLALYQQFTPNFNLKDCLALQGFKPLSSFWVETLKLLGCQLVVVGLYTWVSGGFEGIPFPNPYADFPFSAKVGISLFAILIAPILEESVFRGWVYTYLSKAVPPLVAILSTTLLFTLFHTDYWLSPILLGYVLSLGLLYALWRYRTQSLWPGLLAHFINNVLASYFLLSAA